MAVIYVEALWDDPETKLKNFQCKQAEYEAAYRRTGEPLTLYDALLHATAAGQLTPDWLVEALRGAIIRGRTGQIARRFRERMRDVRRYRCVQDLRRKGLSEDDALDQAVTVLAATDATTLRRTIEASYDRVTRDLKRAGPESAYFPLVAKGEPTVVPVHPKVARTLAQKQRPPEDDS
jgi:hypothetical protein